MKDKANPKSPSEGMVQGVPEKMLMFGKVCIMAQPLGLKSFGHKCHNLWIFCHFHAKCHLIPSKHKHVICITIQWS